MAASIPTAPAAPRTCPYCQTLVGASDAHSCNVCAAPHHGECWRENDGCAVPGCVAAPVAAVAAPAPVARQPARLVIDDLALDAPPPPPPLPPLTHRRRAVPPAQRPASSSEQVVLLTLVLLLTFAILGGAAATAGEPVQRAGDQRAVRSVDGQGKRCSTAYPPGQEATTEGPGKETFLDVAAPEDPDDPMRNWLRRGRVYRAEVAMFAIPAGVDGAVAWLHGGKGDLVSSAVIKLAPGDPYAESLVRLRFRLTQSAARGSRGSIRVCVALTTGGDAAETRGIDLRYRVRR